MPASGLPLAGFFLRLRSCEDRNMQQDQSRRRIAFAAAATAVLLLLAVMLWVMQSLLEQQRMERCLDSRQPDCFRIDVPPRDAGPANLKR